MTKEEIHSAAYKLIFEESGDLSREEFKELLGDVIDDCESMLTSMNSEDEEHDEE
jgi:hypothetical protein